MSSRSAIARIVCVPAAVLLLDGPCVAQTAAADSTAAVLPTAAEVGSAIPSGITPRAALWRSAVLPGWGQWSTGHPVKAALFAGAAAGSIAAAITAAVDDTPPSSVVGRGPGEVATWHEDRAATRNSRVLYFFITATLAGLDAYVDAHLNDFEIEGTDLDVTGARMTYRF